MSEYAGDIIDRVLTITRRKTDDVSRRDYWRMLNSIYFRICKEYSWASLRRKITIDFSVAPTNLGKWLPSNLFGIDAVIDKDNGFEYYNRDRADIDEDERKYRFYTYVANEEDGFFGTDLLLSKDSSTFSSDSLTADGTDFTGFYARFASELGYYLMTTANSFSPVYRGEAIDAGDFRIRPKETLKIATIDSNEEILLDNEVDIYYWQAPQPLYRASDEIVIPNAKLLEVMLLRDLPEAKAYRPVSEGEIEKLTQKTLAMNPTVEYTKPKRDAMGAAFSFSGTSYYSKRG